MKKYVFKKTWKKLIVFFIDIIGYLIFSPLKLFRKKIKKPEKILVLRIDQIGDVIQTIPFFEKLRKKYKNAKIYALITKHSEFLLKNNKNIDEVFVLSTSWFYNDKKTYFTEILKLIKKLRKENIDLSFDLRGDLRNILFLFFILSKNICGYDCAGGGFLLDCKKEYDRDEHEIDKNLKLIDEKSENIVNINFYSSDSANSKIDEFFKKNNYINNKKIAIHPFTRAPAKMWGFNKYNELINKILNYNKNAIVFIIGGKEDKKYIEKINWNNRVLDCIGKFNFDELVAFSKRIDIFIGNDSGPQYLFSYSGKKSCVIYGYTVNYNRWKPKVINKNFIYFSKKVECGPCELTVCNNKKGHICMDIITVDEVFDKVKEWL